MLEECEDKVADLAGTSQFACTLWESNSCSIKVRPHLCHQVIIKWRFWVLLCEVLRDICMQVLMKNRLHPVLSKFFENVRFQG